MVFVKQYRDLDTIVTVQQNAATSVASSIFRLESEDELKDTNVANRVTDCSTVMITGRLTTDHEG
jgi:hypothetical protein